MVMCVQVCEGARMHACVHCCILYTSLCTVYTHMCTHVYGQLVLVSVHTWCACVYL